MLNAQVRPNARAKTSTACLALTLLAVASILGWAPAAASAAVLESTTVPNQTGTAKTSVLEALVKPTRVATYGAWAAWSRYDTAQGGYRLVVRNPAGTITTMGVDERPQPFDVSLGALASGGVGAVYSRCANTAKLKGCHLMQLGIEAAGATEKQLAVPGVGSLYSPALSKRTVAFLRTVPGGGEKHPVELFEWTIGSKHLRALALPRNSFSGTELRQSPELRRTNGYVGRISWLSLSGTQVAYTRQAPIAPAVEVSDLWVQRPGGQPTLIDRTHTGGAATGVRSFLSPMIAGPWLYAYRQYADLGSTWVRYGLSSKTAQQATVNFGDGLEDLVQAAAPLGKGVIWSLLNKSPDGLPGPGGQMLGLTNVTWKAIKRPRPAGPGF
jgi:hypothetical protein